MRIHANPDHTASATDERATGSAMTDGGSGAAPVRVSHQDMLRVFHGGQSFALPDAPRQPLPMERKREIRQRMLDGTYSATSTLHVVARRVLESGEL